MSILPQNHTDEVALLDCVQKFFSKHHVGKLLKQCNGTKEKGVSAVSLLKYKLGNIFVGKSIANSHFLRKAGPHSPDSPGHIKRTVLEISRAERGLRPANQYRAPSQKAMPSQSVR